MADEVVGGRYRDGDVAIANRSPIGGAGRGGARSTNLRPLQRTTNESRWARSAGVIPRPWRIQFRSRRKSAKQGKRLEDYSYVGMYGDLRPALSAKRINCSY